MSLTWEQFDSIVEDVMTDLPFVEWDRGTQWLYEGRKVMRIYGWIEREKDDYKDFVAIEIFEKEGIEEAGVNLLATSSAEYSEDIHRIICGEDKADEHEECFRLEYRFDAFNIIEKSEDWKERLEMIQNDSAGTSRCFQENRF